MRNYLILPLVFALWGCFDSDDSDANVIIEIGVEQLHPMVRSRFEPIDQEISCDAPMLCGDVVELSCHPEVDGPLLYFDNITGEPLANCGGASNCTDPTDTVSCGICPPPEWTCDLQSL